MGREKKTQQNTNQKPYAFFEATFVPHYVLHWYSSAVHKYSKTRWK